MECLLFSYRDWSHHHSSEHGGLQSVPGCYSGIESRALDGKAIGLDWQSRAVQTMFTAILGRLSGGENLSLEEMTAAMDAVMDGEIADEQIGLFLTALRAKGETVDELAGAALSMRKHMTRIRTRHEVVIDTCGTGGGGSKLFNISTAAALVTAAAGVPVAKHGNRAVTSRSGSSDVLAALGVNIAADVARVEKCLDELGICFCFAPLMHPSMKRVSTVRQKLGVPTIFNLLGPLANPAGGAVSVDGRGEGRVAAVDGCGTRAVGNTAGGRGERRRGIGGGECGRRYGGYGSEIRRPPHPSPLPGGEGENWYPLTPALSHKWRGSRKR